MSVYSHTHLSHLSHLNTRTRNACEASGIHTVHDLWERSRRFGLNIHGVGKKGQQQLRRILNKAEDVMGVMPLTLGATSPHGKVGFTLSAYYHSLDEVGKQVMENFYNRFVMHMRAAGQQRLEDACGGPTLSSLVAALVKDRDGFHKQISPKKYVCSEAGQMIATMNAFFQSELWDGYAANLPLTLLRQQVHALTGTLNKRLDDMIITGWNRINTLEFPLRYFVDTVLYAEEALPRGDKGRLERAAKACRNGDATAAKLWAEAKETVAPAWLMAVISQLIPFGFRLPQHYRLANQPYHASDVKGGVVYSGFEDVFITLLYNRDYNVVRYRTGSGMAVLLVKSELAASFDFTGLLREVYAMKNECIRESYHTDLYTLMCPYFEEDGTVDEEELIPVVAGILNDVYDLQTDEKEQLELKRTSKKQTWEYLADILSEKGEPCTLTTLEKELDSHGVVVTRDTIRQHLNDKEQFKVAGEEVYERLYGLAGWKMMKTPAKEPASVVLMVL
ncbi:MAG: hypothetical protein INR73_28190 [Williamsia sp.]|nr:hypothetical protein [Williamsia sp.]